MNGSPIVYLAAFFLILAFVFVFTRKTESFDGGTITQPLITAGPKPSGATTGNDVCGAVNNIKGSQSISFSKPYPVGTTVNVLLTTGPVPGVGSGLGPAPGVGPSLASVSAVSNSGFTINAGDDFNPQTVYYFVIANNN